MSATTDLLPNYRHLSDDALRTIAQDCTAEIENRARRERDMNRWRAENAARTADINFDPDTLNAAVDATIATRVYNAGT